MKLNLAHSRVRYPVVVASLGLSTAFAGCFSGSEYDSSQKPTAQGGAVSGATGGTTATGGLTGTGGPGAGGAAGGAVGADTGGMGAATGGTTGATGGTTGASGADMGGMTGTSGAGAGGMTGTSGADMGGMTGTSGADMGGMAGTSGAGMGGTAGAGGAMGGAAGTPGTDPTYDCEGVTIVCNGQADGKDCKGINQLAYMDAPSLQGPDGNDIWGWTDPDTNKEYALVGLNNGTAFVDISDPCHPVHLGHLRTQTQNALWRDIKTYKNYAYIVAESSGHGMQVFDLTQLRNVANPPAVFQPTNVVDTFGSAHNLALDVETGFAYPLSMNNCVDGRSIDLSDPANPVDLGCWGSNSRTHDAQCLIYKGPDEAFTNKEICITASESRGLFVYDMTNKASVTAVASAIKYPNITYGHQVWLTEDHRYLIMTDESDELEKGINMTLNLFDMSNLATPTHIGQYVSPMENSDHQGYIRGNYFFLSAYSAGLRVFDISNIAAGELTEVGYFDSYPENNVAGYDGEWSVYPYFKSGVLVTNGIVKGLHVLEPDRAWMQDSQWIGW